MSAPRSSPYPLTHSAFWFMHRLWGDVTTGYHLVNIVLHATSAWLLALILRRLAIPGAFLAAVIFALHPGAVESVAWMTELKNTLSGVCYLGCRIDLPCASTLGGTSGAYAGSLVLFVSALLAKTVTAVLPAAMLVVFWWKRGTIDWRRDVRPLIPFFCSRAQRWCRHRMVRARAERRTRVRVSAHCHRSGPDCRTRDLLLSCASWSGRSLCRSFIRAGRSTPPRGGTTSTPLPSSQWSQRAGRCAAGRAHRSPRRCFSAARSFQRSGSSMCIHFATPSLPIIFNTSPASRVCAACVHGNAIAATHFRRSPPS